MKCSTHLFSVFSSTLFLLLTVSGGFSFSQSEASSRFMPADVFQLEYASDPRISPDGSQVVYVRNFMDVMKDRRRSNLWILNFDGTKHRPLTSGNNNHRSPRWSPSGDRLLYLSSEEEGSQIYVRFMDTGQTAKLSRLSASPGNLSWSSDGQWIAFTMFVKEQTKSFAEMPNKPEGAQWAEPARVVDSLLYRSDGGGYLEPGNTHLFVMPAEGGSPRQLTFGSYNHSGAPSWSADGKTLYFSANRKPDWVYDPVESEVFAYSFETGSLSALTERDGPDRGPRVSPDGKKIAYLGFDDRLQGFQVTELFMMNRDGSGKKSLSKDLDRSVGGPIWSSDSKGVFFQYHDKGNTKIARLSLSGKLTQVASDLGGTSIGRPYSGGSFTVAGERFAYTQSKPGYPADIAVGTVGKPVKRITELNRDLFGHKQLGACKELWFDSSHDGRKIQGWVVTPPGFDEKKKYPMILEIHGGPFTNYGDRFSAEVQLFAAAGYVVLYINPRGSTSYGEAFGNLIHHNYPGQDYDDLMSGVDALIKRGFVDEERLYVTGGSGGGVLTSWIVGKTDRFKAAVVAKPVINWTSFALTADAYNFFYKYWFPGFPWDHPEMYRKRSPLSLVGNVTTPTMLLTGEEDYRTPISESEQYYQALQLRKVPSVMVRIPGASHGIAARPSNLISKVVHILKWFEKYSGQK